MRIIQRCGTAGMCCITTERRRRMCWQLMAEALHTSASEVQRKIHDIRNQVSQELRKITTRKSGIGVEDVYTSTWPYFKALNLLHYPFRQGNELQIWNQENSPLGMLPVKTLIGISNT